MKNYVPYQCDSCSKSYFLYEEYLTHVSIEHNQQKDKIICESCPWIIHDKTFYLVHENTHGITKDIHLCRLCPDGFNERSEFVTHYALKHQKQMPPYFKCDTCDFKARTFKKVSEHSKAEHKITYYPFVCSLCDYKCLETRQFTNHVETYHTSNKYICPYCGKDMPTDDKLRNHISLNHEVDKTKKDFVCDLCGYATHMKVRTHSVEKREIHSH